MNWKEKVWVAHECYCWCEVQTRTSFSRMTELAPLTSPKWFTKQFCLRNTHFWLSHVHYLQWFPWIPDAHHNSFASHSAQLKITKGCSRPWVSTKCQTSRTSRTLLAPGKVANILLLLACSLLVNLTWTNTSQQKSGDFGRPLLHFSQQGKEKLQKHIISSTLQPLYLFLMLSSCVTIFQRVLSVRWMISFRPLATLGVLAGLKSGQTMLMPSSASDEDSSALSSAFCRLRGSCLPWALVTVC